jgi:SAM-dependent methyltransferase
MTLRCRICGNTQGHERYAVREMYFGTREKFEYFRCGSCGCLQIVDIPPDMQKYYPAEYHSFDKIKEEKGMKRRLGIKRNEYALFGKGFLGRLLYDMRPPLMPFQLIGRICRTKEHSFLDIGCGSGMLPYYLRDLGIKDVTGIDPFIDSDISYPSGLKILKKSLEEFADEAGRTFDTVMFNHSLEHMPAPGKALENAGRLLKDDGTVMIRIPTVSSYAWEYYRTDWVQLDAPRHFFLFSAESIDILAKKEGFIRYDTVYDSNEFQFWGSEQYRRDVPMESTKSYKHGGTSLFSKRDLDTFRARAAQLNRQGRGDMAGFYLKKLN